jgi:hypothetical protein
MNHSARQVIPSIYKQGSDKKTKSEADIHIQEKEIRPSKGRVGDVKIKNK